jgi:hypothetical protein
MTQRLIPCAHCQRFFQGRADQKEGAFCEAFPEGKGIPTEIILCRVTHRLPYPGDHGLQWLPEPGYEDMFASIDPEDEPLPPGPLGY